jgi:hypothetical protein
VTWPFGIDALFILKKSWRRTIDFGPRDVEQGTGA